jgi:hypothetical protein
MQTVYILTRKRGREDQLFNAVGAFLGSLTRDMTNLHSGDLLYGLVLVRAFQLNRKRESNELDQMSRERMQSPARISSFYALPVQLNEGEKCRVRNAKYFIRYNECPDYNRIDGCS